MRTIIVLLAIVLVLFIARYIWRSKGFSGKQISKKFILYGLATVLVILMLTGRVHWLYGVIGAALPVLGRLFPLVRYVPLLRNYYRRYQASQTASSSNNTGQTSSVQSKYLRMNLNHDTGEMDGDILQGALQGKRLSQLAVEDLVILLSEFHDDSDSVALLQTYLDRVHGDWRESYHSHSGQSQSGQGKGSEQQSATSGLTDQEAYEILGLKPDATKKDIVNAHRRLMQKLHPDRGGSDYLAAKINQAKEFLINKK